MVDMILTSKEIREELSKEWANLVWMLLTDPEYYAPSYEKIKTFVKQEQGDKRKYIPNIYECEEFSLSFMTTLRRMRADDWLEGQTEHRLNWAVGLILTQDGDKIHYKNVCISNNEGVLLIEPQVNLIEKAKDVILEAHYVFM